MLYFQAGGVGIPVKTGDEAGQQTETAATPTPADQAVPPLRKNSDDQVLIKKNFKLVFTFIILTK